jgi:membrane peptidoglycan carboxypeptidase
MREILQGVVDHGTGTNAKLEGVTVAGKTGTAQKIDASTKSYTSSRHVASFVGMFPVESPRFVLLILINNPRDGYYGSQVAAPVFKNIAQRIYGIPTKERPVESSGLAQIELPALENFMLSLVGMEVDNAVDELEDNDLDYEVMGGGKLIQRQEPLAYAHLDSVQTVKLYTETEQVTYQTMPRLTGLTIKEALQILSAWDIPVEIHGSGVVVEQYPAPGKSLENKVKITLVCKPA